MKQAAALTRLRNLRTAHASLAADTLYMNRSALCYAALALAVTATLVPSPARAVSTANETYAAALRLRPHTEHGAQLFELCTACHGADGAGSADGSVPAIAGQYVPVLIKQLIEFRSDSRHSIRVQGFLSHHRLAPQDLADVAAYVSSLAPRQPPDSLQAPHSQHAADLFQNHCAGCHGPQAEGNSSARVPRLAGQHSEYLIRQMRDAAEGARPSMNGDHSRLLAQLSVDDLSTVSEYLAAIRPMPRTPPE